MILLIKLNKSRDCWHVILSGTESLTIFRESSKKYFKLWTHSSFTLNYHWNQESEWKWVHFSAFAWTNDLNNEHEQETWISQWVQHINFMEILLCVFKFGMEKIQTTPPDSIFELKFEFLFCFCIHESLK